jgi:hypothetical protein
MKEAAVTGAEVFDTITKTAVWTEGRPPEKGFMPIEEYLAAEAERAAATAQDVPAAQDVPDVQNAKNKGGRPRKSAEPMERLSLKIPVSIKEYLTVAAARESIATRKKVSPTDYLCGLIRADMEQHKDD